MPALRVLVAGLCLVLAPGLAAASGAGSGASSSAAGVAPDGSKGKLHVVQKGDTLWHLADRYLGTPWIWPSLWKENDDIHNPHLIYPGDLIWITERGMRKVTPEEAAQLLAAQEAGGPAGQQPFPDGGNGGESDPFDSLDAEDTSVQRKVHFPGLHRYSFVDVDELNGSGAVLGSHTESYWVSQGRETIVGIGEGQAHVGDHFTVFRVRRRIIHPETGKVAGYLTQVLGLAEITEIHPESSFAKVVTSYSEIEPGDRILPYEELPDEVLASSPSAELSGIVLAQQPYRQFAGEGELVILDRGAHDGVAPGNRFEIFRAGKEILDPISRERVLVPDHVIGRAFVLRASQRSALALVTRARTEVLTGDRFRTN